MVQKADIPTPLAISPGPAGWARVVWRLHEPGEIVALVRFTVGEAPELRLEAVELRVAAPWLHRHRELPLSRIENAANADAFVHGQILTKYRKREPSPRELDKYFALPPAQRDAAERFRLQRPEQRRLPDDFYKQVARAYKEAVAAGLNPRKTLAADSGAPADTVARWITAARRPERGYLPPAKPGKVSA